MGSGSCGWKYRLLPDPIFSFTNFLGYRTIFAKPRSGGTGKCAGDHSSVHQADANDDLVFPDYDPTHQAGISGEF